MTYRLIFPEDFEDYAWEVEVKGWFSDASIDVDGKVTQLLFYDPVRLKQDIELACSQQRAFMARNLVVVSKITRKSIEETIKELYLSGSFNDKI